MELRTPLLLREPPRSRSLGPLVSIASVAVCTAAIYPLKPIAPDVSLGVVYLTAVIGVSICERATPPTLQRYIRTDPGVGYRFGA
jgi:hypothetical protein